MKLMVCVPGERFSVNFLKSWTETIVWGQKNGHKIMFTGSECPNIYLAREMCLMMNSMGGTDQLPFHGEDYDYVLWIDSDQVWKSSDIQMLIDADKDIISAAIMQADDHFACGCIDEDFVKTGMAYRPTEKTFEMVDEPIEVSFVGLGFCLIKKKVLDAMKFPFFPARRHPDRPGLLSEDISFMFTAKDLGFKIYVHPKVRVLHEKTVLK